MLNVYPSSECCCSINHNRQLLANHKLHPSSSNTSIRFISITKELELPILWHIPDQNVLTATINIKLLFLPLTIFNVNMGIMPNSCWYYITNVAEDKRCALFWLVKNNINKEQKDLLSHAAVVLKCSGGPPGFPCWPPSFGWVSPLSSC